MFCNIEIFLNEKCVQIKAMIDTGNLLKDPISGMPVIVVEKRELEGIIPSEIINNLNVILQGENKEFEQDELNEFLHKFRVIPFTSLGKQNGLLLGFIADKIVIKFEENEKTLEKIIIGIYDKYLTKNGAYTGLVGLDIIERCEKNESFADVKI